MLPFGPFKVYEREAIEKYFEGKSPTQIKSPITMQSMGKTLRPAIQHRNTVETLIETGAIEGDMADTWKTRMRDHVQKKELLRKAEAGDVNAMEMVASSFYFGENGFAEDTKAAFEWYEKAHRQGSVIAMAEAGAMLVLGNGAEQDESQGLVYLGIAAGKGSDLAAYALGLYFADGDHGLPRDNTKAIELLQFAVRNDCPHSCMNERAKHQAQEKLDLLTSPTYDPDDEL